MVKIRIIAVGKTKEDWITQAIRHYLKLLKRYAEVELVEIKTDKIITSLSIKSVLEKEANKIRSLLKPSDLNVLLDVKGRCKSSEEFADFFENNLKRGYNEFTFLLGGPLGVAPKIRETCSLRLSLSPMTFTHEMSRVILLEQIYRAFSILQGSKYHK